MRAIPFLLSAMMMLSGCGTMQVGERNFIRPDKPGTAAPPRLELGKYTGAGTIEEEDIATPDGALLSGIIFNPHPAAGRVILYFGGNMFHLDQHGAELLPQLTSCGTGVAVFDHRGYGRSRGEPNLVRMAADAVRVFDLVNARFPGQVIVHGQSLGSILAAHVAQQRPAARAIVLEATTSTVQDWVDANVPWYVAMVTKVEVETGLKAVDNVAAMRAYQGPSLVLAGERDKVTPVALARKVYDAIPGQRKQWHLSPGAGHNDTFGRADVMPLYCKFVTGA
jgi:pimeloyl-ACP methyl ester carboxylesterase